MPTRTENTPALTALTGLATLKSVSRKAGQSAIIPAMPVIPAAAPQASDGSAGCWRLTSATISTTGMARAISAARATWTMAPYRRVVGAGAPRVANPAP